MCKENNYVYTTECKNHYKCLNCFQKSNSLSCDLCLKTCKFCYNKSYDFTRLECQEECCLECQKKLEVHDCEYMKTNYECDSCKNIIKPIIKLLQQCNHKFCEKCLNQRHYCPICYKNCSYCGNFNLNMDQSCCHPICSDCEKSFKECIFCSKKSENYLCSNCKKYKIFKNCQNNHNFCVECHSSSGFSFCLDCDSCYETNTFTEINGLDFKQYNRCYSCLNISQCKSCKNYLVKANIQENYYCLCCNSNGRCECNRIVPIYIFQQFNGKCNFCQGCSPCSSCNLFFKNDIIQKLEGQCESCSHLGFCIKCDSKAVKSQLKQSEGLCEKCYLHACDVCYSKAPVNKKNCGHFECQKCEIVTSNNICAKCQNKYHCKEHTSDNYLLLENSYYYTENCCRLKICAICRLEKKENHKCPGYTKK